MPFVRSIACSVTLPERTISELDRLAAELKMTRSGLIRLSVDSLLREKGSIIIGKAASQ